MDDVILRKYNFEKVFYKVILILLILSAIILFFSGFYFDENFFLSKSQDGELYASTIQKIHKIQITSLLLGTFFVFLILILLKYRNNVYEIIIKKKSIIQNVLLLIATLFFIFLIGEGFARIALSNDSFGGDFGPSSLKFNSEIERNSDEMRDRDFSIEKPINTKRIGVIGDSFSFGWGVNDTNKVYAKVLERKLNSVSDINYEVLNFGEPDSDTGDEINLLNEKALKYDLDVIIIGYYINDLKNIDDNNKESSFYLEFPFIGFVLRNTLYSYYFLETRSNYFIDKYILKESYLKILKNRFDSEVNRNFAKELFKEIKDISDENNINVVIVNFPVIYLFDDYPLERANELLREISMENDFYLVDMFETYKDYREDELIVSIYDRHPNELGHEIAGNRIFNEFVQRGLVN